MFILSKAEGLVLPALSIVEGSLSKGIFRFAFCTYVVILCSFIYLRLCIEKRVCFELNGILVIDKPRNWTSHDVVKKIKRHFGLGKVGHSGTLDPNATGVLVLCIDAATRFVRFLPCDPKKYRGEMILGIRTDTLDVTGKVVDETSSNISLEEVKKVSNQFLGHIEQVPPMVSAVKVGGTPLYVLARQGKDIKRKPRTVEIFDLTVLELVNEGRQKVLFETVCSKGTYIRALCVDIGEKLGCGACLGDLTRVESGAFKYGDARKLDDVLRLEPEKLKQILIPLTDALAVYPAVKVKDGFKIRFLNGGFLTPQMVEMGDRIINKGEKIRILDSRNNFLGLASVDKEFSTNNIRQIGHAVIRPICVLPIKCKT